MTDALLIILTIELGLILFAMVGIFGLDTYAMLIRSREEKRGQGTLRTMTAEELVAHGMNPADFMNPTGKAPGTVDAKLGNYA